MAKSSHTIRLDRFADVSEEPRRILQPIEGYQSLDLVSLEDAIVPVVEFCPDVRRRAYVAKGNCDVPKDGLTQDESAAIFLYTSEWAPREQCLYVVLNAILRSANRNRRISPWLSYMKLFLTALFKLPSCSMTVWRGVQLDLRNEYKVGQTITWWGFSSCTESAAVLESEVFLGDEGKRTIFSIKCFNGKQIRGHSSIEGEDEILLLPGSQFVVKGHLQPSKKDPDLIFIQLEQIEPPFNLLEEPSPGMSSFTSTSMPHLPKKHTQPDVEIKGKPGTTASPIQSKTNSPKSSPSYPAYEATPKMNETTKYKAKPNNQEFAAPGAYEKLYCDGRHCASCGKCRDWYFTGDATTWKWIKNHKNWKQDDKDRWYNDGIYKLFKRRDGATCAYYYSAYGYSHAYHGAHLHGYLRLRLHRLHRLHCLCDNNIVN